MQTHSTNVETEERAVCEKKTLKGTENVDLKMQLSSYSTSTRGGGGVIACLNKTIKKNNKVGIQNMTPEE